MRPWFAAAILAVLASATVWGQIQELATGRFLVASRSLGDPNFAETVILLVRYNEDDGSVGLIINRQTDIPLSRVFRDIKGAKVRKDPVFMGGPVEPGGVLALLKSSSKPEEATKIFADVYLVSSRALLEKSLTAGVEASAFRVYLGYAGWGAGQLEHEMELGAWHVLPAEAATVFDPDPDAVWARMIRKTELRIARRRWLVASGW
jgi:putative transcriptional regulator